jgi:hypothetical protein
MAHTIVSYRERPELDERWEQTVAPAWPEFAMHDTSINANWDTIFEHAPDFQFYVLDEDTDEVLALGNTMPFAWDGDAGTLPTGIGDILLRAIADREADRTPTASCALQAIVTTGNRGKGLASVVLGEMRARASAAGFEDLVAPVRPSWKARYPLQDLGSYARWTRSDGLPFDPWIRVHVRAGAEFVKVAPDAQTVEGTLADWGSWTGMAFPESGRYIVDGALVPLEVDVERDRGRLVEPNYWMRHRLDPAGR